MKNFGLYLKNILFPIIVGGVVGLIISNFMDYNFLERPPLAPPSILFPVIWTILYILMGISYGIIKQKSILDMDVQFIYYLQLFVNALWSIFFFVFKIRLFSFFWIILLALLIFIMIVKFYQKNKLSGLLQIPYFVWVLFASYLNLAIYILNK